LRASAFWTAPRVAVRKKFIIVLARGLAASQS
jgi:hypothetical protein